MDKFPLATSVPSHEHANLAAGKFKSLQQSLKRDNRSEIINAGGLAIDSGLRTSLPNGRSEQKNDAKLADASERAKVNREKPNRSGP